MFSTIVKEYNGSQVLLKDAAIIESTFVIWAAGIKGNIPEGIKPDFISKLNQIKTDMYHCVIATENVLF